MPDSDEPNHPIDREARPEEWRAAVDSNTAIITQFDDGAEGGAGLFSSSCSAPATVRDFLSALDLRDRDRVLEIGTGTGWTAALISHRVGSENVTSIEIDPEVLAQAEKNLKQAGLPSPPGPRGRDGSTNLTEPPTTVFMWPAESPKFPMHGWSRPGRAG